jgi:hypothetical protein
MTRADESAMRDGRRLTLVRNATVILETRRAAPAGRPDARRRCCSARFVDSSPLVMTTDDTVFDLRGYGNEEREEESSCP